MRCGATGRLSMQTRASAKEARAQAARAMVTACAEHRVVYGQSSPSRSLLLDLLQENP